jgi:hypothetical protein
MSNPTNPQIDTYSMERLYDLQDQFLPNPDDRLLILGFVSNRLHEVIKTLTPEDFKHLKAYNSCTLILDCCDSINKINLERED